MMLYFLKEITSTGIKILISANIVSILFFFRSQHLQLQASVLILPWKTLKCLLYNLILFQVVPIPTEVTNEVKHAFEDMAESMSIELTDMPEHSSLTQVILIFLQ